MFFFCGTVFAFEIKLKFFANSEPRVNLIFHYLHEKLTCARLGGEDAAKFSGVNNYCRVDWGILHVVIRKKN